LLIKLVHDASPEVRINLAFNPVVTDILLAELAEDEDADVRFALAENPAVPRVTLQRLSTDENPYVAHRAARTLEKLEPVFTTVNRAQFQAA
jgi:hypothetical protein